MRRNQYPHLQRGAVAVEAALLTIPLVLLALGIAEGGRALFQYNTLVKATRDATRYLSMVPAGTGLASARCLAINGNSTCTGDPLVPGLDASKVSICDSISCPATHRNVPSVGSGTTATGVIDLVTVQINGVAFANLTPLPIGGFTFGPISNTMRQEL